MSITLPLLALASSALLLLDGCGPAVSSSTPDSVRTDVADPQRGFTRILTQNTSGFLEPTDLVIRDATALRAAWTTLFEGIPGNALPAVDFASETVVVLALGQRSSGGYTVKFDGVTRAGGAALVRYTATSPGRDCMTTQMMTSPVDVVRVPRLDPTVRFERRDVTAAC